MSTSREAYEQQFARQIRVCGCDTRANRLYYSTKQSTTTRFDFESEDEQARRPAGQARRLREYAHRRGGRRQGARLLRPGAFCVGGPLPRRLAGTAQRGGGEPRAPHIYIYIYIKNH